MKKTAIWTTIGIFFMAAVAAAQQQPSTGAHHSPEHTAQQQQDDGQAWLPPWVKSLPAEKQAVFQRIVETRTNVIYPLEMQRRAQQAQLQAELAQNSVNSTTIDKTLKNIDELSAKINRAQIDLMLDVKKEFPQAFMRHGMMGPGMGMGPAFGDGMGMMGGGMMGGGMMGGGMMGHGKMGGGKGMMGGHGMGGGCMMGHGGAQNQP